MGFNQRASLAMWLTLVVMPLGFCALGYAACKLFGLSILWVLCPVVWVFQFKFTQRMTRWVYGLGRRL